MDKYTLPYLKWITNNELVQHKEHCSHKVLSCNTVIRQPRQRGVWRRLDTCICMAELLCFLPKTITKIFISYLLLFRPYIMPSSFSTPCTIVSHASLSMGFPRQGYQRFHHFLLQGIFLNQGLNPISCIGRQFFTTETPGKHLKKSHKKDK